jgi:hypothetical protein
MIQGKDSNADRKKEYQYSEEMEKDRRYEETFAKYYEGINDGRYAKNKEKLDEIGRDLPEWDILPPVETI